MSKPTQTLVLYKRHVPRCTVLKSRVPVEKQRFVMTCGCPIWIYGKTPEGDIVPRQSTGESDLTAAEAVRDSLTSKVAGNEETGPSIMECVERYISSRQHEIGQSSLYQYRLCLDRFVKFCAGKGTHFMRQLNLDILEDFKSTSFPSTTVGTTKSLWVSKVRTFLKDAHRRGWIAVSLVDRFRAYRSVHEQKEPFTEKEVETILTAPLQTRSRRFGYAIRPGTFRLLIELMLETGMRVGDAVRYNVREVQRGEYLWVYTFTPQKQRKDRKPKQLEAYISDELKNRIDQCQWMSKEFPFAYGRHKTPAHLSIMVYRMMQGIGGKCKVDDCRPHRLRDTFAVRKLLSGVSLDDLSQLLGHSSVKVTEQYYARWVRGRKLRLERLVSQSLMHPDGNAGRD